MNHFTAIGIPLHTMEDAPALFTPLLDDTTPLESTIPGYVYWVWEAGQGTEIWFQFNETTNTIISSSPAFKGMTRITVNVTQALEEESPLEALLQGWVNPRDNDPESGDYPMVFTWLDKGLHPQLEYPQIHTFQITAFAHELVAYPNEDAFSAANQNPGSSANDNDVKVSFAPESFIPSGMFVEEEGDTPTPTAMFTGHVLEVRELTTPLSDTPFYWIRVKTFGGEYDVVATNDVIKGKPITGGIVTGVFWLRGRMLDQ